MELAEEMEKIERLTQRVREAETPGRRGAAYCYARAIFSAFSEIAALREEGFSMAAICKVMESDGLLPERASPHSFRRAFRKELARRDKTAKMQNADSLSSMPGDTSEEKPAAPSPKSVTTSGGNKHVDEKAATAPDNAEQERIKRLLGIKGDTGNGKTVRQPDGSFSY